MDGEIERKATETFLPPPLFPQGKHAAHISYGLVRDSMRKIQVIITRGFGNKGRSCLTFFFPSG